MGDWALASYVLGRPVSMGEPYPHVCNRPVRTAAGRQITMWRRDCAACQAELGAQR